MGAAKPADPATFLAIGVDKYVDQELEPLPGVASDLETMAALLTELGFQGGQATPGHAPTCAEVRAAFERWMDEPAHKAVIYWGGHARVDTSGKLALLTSDSPAQRWTPTRTVFADELSRYIALSKTKEVLLVIDTCHAGAASDLFSRLWTSLDECRSKSKVWLLAAVSAAQHARENDAGGGLVRALDGLIRYGSPAGVDRFWTQNDRFISVDNLARALEALGPRLESRGLHLNPELSGRRPLDPSFLRNIGFQKSVPARIVAEAQRRRGSALDDEEAERHFWPYSRGVEVGETGWYFVGRKQLLSRIVSWLSSSGGPRLQVITGKPGAGKSAILGRIATLADPAYRAMAEKEGVLADAPPGTVPAPGTVSMSILLHKQTLDDCLKRIAEGIGLDLPPDRRLRSVDVLSALAEAGRPDDVILMDGLDEASDPYQIAEFIRQLAQRRRVLLGTRQNRSRGSGPDAADLGPLLNMLRVEPGQVVELDRDADARNDIEHYVERLLTDPTADCPYRWHQSVSVTKETAAAIADAADGVFRLGHDWCRLLCREPEALAPGSPPFRDLLRCGAKGVFELELTRAPGGVRVRELLSALAWSEGGGMPREEVWPAAATAIAGLPGGSGSRYGAIDVIETLREAGHLVMESGEHGETVYRPYHQEFTEYLRDQTPAPAKPDCQRAIAEALAKLGRACEWWPVAPYLSYHLPAHAAAGDFLDEVITDPGFLAAADPAGLLRVIGAVRSESAREYQRLYVQAAHRLSGRLPADRAVALDLSAHQQRSSISVAVGWAPAPWRTLWAHWGPSVEFTTLEGHDDAVQGVAMGEVEGSPVVATGSDDGTARLWDARSGAHLRTLSGHDGWVLGVAIGEVEGRSVLASASEDGTARLWDAHTGAPLHVLAGHNAPVQGVALGKVDGRPVVATGGDDGTARLWDAHSGRPLRTLKDHADRVMDVAMGEVEGRPVVATASADHTARLWDGRSGRLLRELSGHSQTVWGVAIGQVEGRPVVATASADHTARLWDARSGKPLRTLNGHDGMVMDLALGELDGRPVLATASADRTARLWDARSGRPLSTLRGHDSVVTGVALRAVAGRTVLATASSDVTARLWDPSGRQQLRAFEGHIAGVTGMAIGEVEDQPVLATAGIDGTARLWDVRSGEHLRTLDNPNAWAKRLPILQGQFVGVMDVALGDVEGRPVLATANVDRTARLWDARKGALLRTLDGHSGPVTSVALGHVDGRSVLATASRDGTTRLWDASSAEPLRTLQGHTEPVTGVALRDLEGRPVLASVSYGTVRLWDARSGELVSTLRGQPAITGMALGEIDGRATVATTNIDRAVRLWDPSTGMLLLTLEGHAGPVTGVALGEVAGQPVLATISKDGTARIWHAHSRTPVLTVSLDAPAQVVAMAGPVIAFACTRGVVVLERRPAG